MADITRLVSKNVEHCKYGECFWNGKEKGEKNIFFLIVFFDNKKFLIIFVVSKSERRCIKVTKQEKVVVSKVITLLRAYQEFSNKDYLNQEADRLILFLEKRLD